LAPCTFFLIHTRNFGLHKYIIKVRELGHLRKRCIFEKVSILFIPLPGVLRFFNFKIVTAVFFRPNLSISQWRFYKFLQNNGLSYYYILLPKKLKTKIFSKFWNFKISKFQIFFAGEWVHLLIYLWMSHWRFFFTVTLSNFIILSFY